MTNSFWSRRISTHDVPGCSEWNVLVTSHDPCITSPQRSRSSSDSICSTGAGTLCMMVIETCGLIRAADDATTISTKTQKHVLRQTCSTHWWATAPTTNKLQVIKALRYGRVNSIDGCAVTKICRMLEGNVTYSNAIRHSHQAHF